RLRENRTIKIVEAAHDLARQLDVRRLILARRDKICTINDYIRSLQERISEKAERVEVAILHLLLLLFERRHSLEPAERRDHRQQQMQLGMLLDLRLQED